MSRDIAPFGLRMAADLKARVQSAADANGRSMNAEIVATLEKAYPAPLSLELIKRLQGLIDDRIAEARAKIDRKELLADQELDDIERDLLANIELLNSLTSALDARIEAVKQGSETPRENS